MKENETGKNVSSGAKKVETIEKQTRKNAAEKSKRGTGKTKTTKKQTARTVTEKVAQENKAAQERMESAKERASRREQNVLKKAEARQAKAQKRAELKAKKLERKAERVTRQAKRKQMQAERAAALKEQREEQKAAHAARREMLAHETKAEKQKRLEREKKERIASKMQKRETEEKKRAEKMKAREAARERRAQNARQKREKKSMRKNRTPGFGGWLAAVISLGAVCLILSTIVTAGALRMGQDTMRTANGYRATLFEMASVSEEMDSSFSKLRVSTGAAEQRKLLTDILVDSAVLESAMEKIPVDLMTSTDISAFVNQTGLCARRLLQKLASGNGLDEKETTLIGRLGEINSELYRELNELTVNMEENDFMAFIRGNEGQVGKKFNELGETIHHFEEDVIFDAPFSHIGNVGENMLNGEEIGETKAKQCAEEYFHSYHIAQTQCVGEATIDGKSFYNFVLTDEDGVEIFVQISKNGGQLVLFDCYRECDQKNFDLSACDKLAKEYLQSVGIEDVEAVWMSDGGMVADITYVGVQDGVRIYSDLIRVRVCESKGIVVGMDASRYFFNHHRRTIGKGVGWENAMTHLSPCLKAYAAHTALVPIDGREVLCYEYGCTFDHDEYLVYLDAATGEEVQIYKVRTGARGSWIR